MAGNATATPIDLEQLAGRLDGAALAATATPQLPEGAALTPAVAYAVQALVVGKRLARGDTRTGIKMGLTSRAKMEQVNVDEVIFGQLTSGMWREEGAPVARGDFIHPRAEPEIAFLLKKPLEGRVTIPEAVAALEAVAPAVEIIDSRYENFRFALGDVIADNSSSAGYVVGGFHPPHTDIANLGIVLSVNGEARQIGSSAAILGHPLRSLVAAARMVARLGLRLNPGDIVLAGGATAAVPLAAGDHVSTEFQNIGRVQFLVR
ncbi:MAG: 2-keto-4-pentenoate hydratase [Pseudochelatococcus sp.]|jgi:2-oxo-3-hexenedioate decarboxylase|uniref:2-keto-4-pentenoate hydratase n=1 Tax=Pseudochelatococcus sp. TaxID=2020869 RepID=UPI003D93FCD7